MNFPLQLLKILKSNLQKMQSLLSYGDGETAVQITFQNEKIIGLLEKYKSFLNESMTSDLQNLIKDCSYLQEECDEKLQAITSEYKKELNIHLIKRQLFTHFNNLK